MSALKEFLFSLNANGLLVSFKLLEKEGLREGGAFPSRKELTISKFLTDDEPCPS